MPDEGHPSRLHEIILIGVGAVAETHLKVLQDTAEASVVAGVDPAPRGTVTFRGSALPVYRTLREAADRHGSPSLVVVTTPTPTHAAVCAEVVELFPSVEILMEKPAADNLADAIHILTDLAGKATINVGYHMAFSPEVLWAQRLVRDRAGALGAPSGVRALFTDPYESDIESARARYGTSWIDSGVNALSVLARFVRLLDRTSLRSLGFENWSAFEGHIACQAGATRLDALVITSWHVTDPGRTTRIRFESGAELVMDHHAVAGYLIGPGGRVEEMFGSDGRTPRRETHYQNMYRAYYRDGNPVMSAEESRRLHELLLRES